MYLETYTMYLATKKGGRKIKSRADYFKQRRKTQKAFYVEIEAEKMEQLERQLLKKNETKKQWLNEKIDEELSKDVKNKK